MRAALACRARQVGQQRVARRSISARAPLAPEAKELPGRRTGLQRQRRVLEQGKAGEQARDLERTRQPRAARAGGRQRRDVEAVENTMAFVVASAAGQLRHQRGLAGAVGADQRMTSPATERVDVIGGHQAARNDDDQAAHVSSGSSWTMRPPQCTRRRNSTTASSTQPVQNAQCRWWPRQHLPAAARRRPSTPPTACRCRRGSPSPAACRIASSAARSAHVAGRFTLRAPATPEPHRREHQPLERKVESPAPHARLVVAQRQHRAPQARRHQAREGEEREPPARPAPPTTIAVVLQVPSPLPA